MDKIQSLEFNFVRHKKINLSSSDHHEKTLKSSSKGCYDSGMFYLKTFAYFVVSTSCIQYFVDKRLAQ